MKDSPLHIILKMDDIKVSRLEKVEIVKYLLSKGVSVNSVNRYGLTPVHLAAQLQYPDILEILVKSGGNINAVTTTQQNALHLAIRPIINLCPNLTVQPLIPNQDVKYRDINDISKALWQHLNSLDIKNAFENAAKIISSPVTTTPTASFEFYPLIAIKNIISNSSNYLNEANKNYLETKRSEMLSGIQKINQMNTLTQADKDMKIRLMLSEMTNAITSELKKYYTLGIHPLPFNSNNSVYNTTITKKLTYFAQDNSEGIFATNGINYHGQFDQAITMLDEKYNGNLQKISSLLTKIYKDVESEASTWAMLLAGFATPGFVGLRASPRSVRLYARDIRGFHRASSQVTAAQTRGGR